MQTNLLHLLLKCVDDGIEHFRMKGVRILNVPANDLPFIQHFLEIRYGSDWAGHHAQARTIDQRDG